MKKTIHQQTYATLREEGRMTQNRGTGAEAEARAVGTEARSAEAKVEPELWVQRTEL